ncbi:MAG: hypothetical protein HC796_08575 [Synechococcaceae cyanobacterium RL_1_2]|nr:hypothetical protein [Synechococcaceae cyanobacterium RL_1_2]
MPLWPLIEPPGYGSQLPTTGSGTSQVQDRQPSKGTEPLSRPFPPPTNPGNGGLDIPDFLQRRRFPKR